MNKEKEEKLAEISARITKVIDYLGETPNSFATKLGYQRAQTVYDIQKMKSAPSYDFFQRFSIAGFSAEIDIDWLLTGNGSMLKQNVLNDKNTDNTLVPSDKDTSKKRINQEETSYLYKIYQEEKADWKAEKKEKDAKIDQLQSELRAQSAELAALKAQSNSYPHLSHDTEHGSTNKDLTPAKHASIKKHSSPPNADNATSATAPSE